jgi:hypothetical protein
LRDFFRGPPSPSRSRPREKFSKNLPISEFPKSRLVAKTADRKALSWARNQLQVIIFSLIFHDVNDYIMAAIATMAT